MTQQNKAILQVPGENSAQDLSEVNQVPQIHRSTLEVGAVTIRFSGDSGDGMQLTGSQFTSTTALVGNDLATLPDFPAEIRAPAGTLAGVSGFQVQFGSSEIFTPGDRPDVLVAMNPAALKKELGDLARGATIIINSDAFDARSIEKAGFVGDPLEDGTLESFRVFKVPLTTMTHRSLEATSLSKKDKDRSKNFFALGLMYWLYGRPLEHSLRWIERKFAKTPEYAESNSLALKAGYNFGVTTEIFTSNYTVPEASIEPGLYRQITGNQATAFGFIAAAELSGLDLFLGSYPITPASDILHELSRYKHFGVRTFQAEDEIAAIGAALGAAFGGHIGLTTTSGPGVCLKSEAINLAIMVELPLVVANIQRGGPSTGLPTKTEQADLLQALYGRNGESPIPIIAAATPSDCFFAAIEAVRIAVKYMTPVFFLSDGYIANGAEPWKLPEDKDLPTISARFRTEAEGFFPYLRDPATLARPWVRPGTPGLEHRIGGLEKAEKSGNVSYDSFNHEKMVRLRADKIAGIASDIPDAELHGDESGDILLIGWGGTFGALRAATKSMRQAGVKISHLHLRHLNPLPKNVATVIRSFGKICVAELNLGQLLKIIRSEFLVDAIGINKVQGQPFRVSELVERISAILNQDTVGE